MIRSTGSLSQWDGILGTNERRAGRIRRPSPTTLFLVGLACVLTLNGCSAKRGKSAADSAATPASVLRTLTPDATKTITEADCTAGKLGTTIPRSLIGEPVSGVTLSEPKWIAASGDTESLSHCSVDGSMAPVDSAPTAKPINFRVVFPEVWRYRAIQFGGSGMNGSVRVGKPSSVMPGFAMYGSDSGHQGDPWPVTSQDWALNEEAIRNFGYMQMKKTHDAAMVLIVRMYGEKPRVNYYLGMSQGGREALMVAQRYPADYDGVAAFVPVVDLSSLVLAPVWVRIQERELARWVTPAKTEAIRSEFIRQCDGLDGLADGIINNYGACRAIFDVGRQAPGRGPWKSKRCPGDRDPARADTSSQACLSDGQIATLEFVYSRYHFATPLANGRRSFGMWLPDVDPGEAMQKRAEDWGLRLIQGSRFKGQQGAPAGASVFSHVGAAGVVGFLMRDLRANPLDYVEGGTLDERRREISKWLDATDSDLTSFYKRGGKLIVMVGTNDTMAASGDQLDYLQALMDTMGQPRVDAFARLFVAPQADHNLYGQNYSVTGDGEKIRVAPIPSPNFLQGFEWLVDWVENKIPPGKSPTVTTEDGSKSLPLCCYPAYPRYVHGPANLASSYRCVLP